ncbi:MAG: CoB--CoM heterodisulfide reductase iron-sulfur subunit B family protein [Deltaproteobacteria bacterium]|nr:CoB--CoM heterodisulfide reductase iron-sulfur subunit B family protein [Deltaproteobacteria bacterium]MBW2304348.1 CoB--CoM heterodisulfide reductase iron-sulfur subunit B family protein [Deltaproteobacteria bacterium]
MKYIYYPGCSLEGTALEYNLSTRAVLAALGADLSDLEDWTCCGASAAEASSRLLSLVLAARNLALAERSGEEGGVLIPCSACYLNLRRVGEQVRQEPDLKQKINEALAEEDLRYEGGLAVRHLLEVLVVDFGPERTAERVTRPLKGVKVAPYYGCQALRPYATFDDPQMPRSMEPLIEALGAEVHPWSLGAKCCGAALMNTKREVALELTGALLEGAEGADCIVTVCPMCQMNLEAYQDTLSRQRGRDLHLSILYLPQLMGLAFGLPEEDLHLDMNLALYPALKARLNI